MLTIYSNNKAEYIEDDISVVWLEMGGSFCGAGSFVNLIRLVGWEGVIVKGIMVHQLKSEKAICFC
jgi:hypothetical protein